MSEHCSQDGGFIGKAGCTHPNHQHSELVKGLLAEKAPRMISAVDCDAALKEGFYVDSVNGKRIGFGSSLDRHLNEDHALQPKDAEARKKRLLYAIDAVRSPDKEDSNHQGLAGRTAYIKSFDGFGVMAIADTEGSNIEQVFNIIPKRGLKKGLPPQSRP
jgi:hypothetical protein